MLQQGMAIMRLPVDVSVHCCTINKFETQKIAQISVIPRIHYHERTLADVGAVTGRLVEAEFLDRNSILTHYIHQAVKKGSSTILRVPRRAFLEQRVEVINQCDKKFVHVILPHHLRGESRVITPDIA